jgi:hypothetical protein
LIWIYLIDIELLIKEIRMPKDKKVTKKLNPMAAAMLVEVVKDIKTMIAEHKAAPVRSSYNKLTGSYGKTKNDILRAFKADMTVIELAYKALTGSSSAVFDDIKKLEPADDEQLW